jgi:thiamine biosynthesis lipoprotein
MGLGLLVCAATIVDVGAQDVARFGFTRYLMGTEAKVVLYAADSTEAASAAGQAFDHINELNEQLSDYMTDSEVSRLSKTRGQPIAVGENLWNVLITGQNIAHASEGSFDVTVGPLTLLWRKAMRRATLPDAVEITNALAAVGYWFLELDASSRTVQLNGENMRLDLGGIAKGYAADEALKTLMKAGFSSAAVDIGGDIALGNAPPGSSGWSVEVFDLNTEGELETEKLILENCGIAVSGDTYRYLEYDGVKYSHIINPRTGYGVEHERRVAVVAPSAMIADAWASAYSVMVWESAISDATDRANLSTRFVERREAGLQEVNTGKFLRD